ncbi:MAG: tetratricopeptide repeat protein [Pseudomonadota bacterium]
MFRFPIVICVLLSGFAVAAPIEDHWSPDPDTPYSVTFAKAAKMVEAKDYHRALPILKALALDAPGDPDVYNLLGFASRKTGNLDAASKAYARALFLSPDHLGALAYQGELFLTLGDPAGAAGNHRRLEKLCPSPCAETDELASSIAKWKANQTQ